MKNPKVDVMVTLAKIMVKGRKHYAVPRTATLQALLERFYGLKIAKRTVYWHLEGLQESGLICRRRRWSKLGGDDINSLPAMITISYRGVQWLYRHGFRDAGQLIHRTMDWLRKSDGRFPVNEEIIAGAPDYDRGISEVRKILASLSP